MYIFLIYFHGKSYAGKADIHLGPYDPSCRAGIRRPDGNKKKAAWASCGKGGPHDAKTHAGGVADGRLRRHNHVRDHGGHAGLPARILSRNPSPLAPPGLNSFRRGSGALWRIAAIPKGFAPHVP